MSKQSQSSPGPVFLGIEAGGTRTLAAAMECVSPTRPLAHHASRITSPCNEGIPQLLETGPANLRLVSDAQLARHFREIAQAMPRPVSVAIGMAGARTKADRARICQAAAKVWPGVPCYATNDLETALMGAETKGRDPATGARVLVLSGTGSCCFGRTPAGETAKVGGWGHILGDKGSGYEIGLRGLKAVVYYYDQDRKWPALGSALLCALQLNEP